MSEEQQIARFHRKEYPVPGELVIGKNVKITELGVYVNLLEYGNLEGLVVIGELSKKRIRNIHKLIKINKIEVLSVLRVDKAKGYIDLSRKKVIESDFNNTYRSYIKNKIANNIISSLANRLNEHPIRLYEQWAWEKAEKYNSLYEYFGYLQEAYNYQQGIKQEKIFSESDDSSSEKEVSRTESSSMHIENIKSGVELDQPPKDGQLELENSLQNLLLGQSGTKLALKPSKYTLDTLLGDIPEKTHSLLLEQINLKYNIQNVKIRADVEMTCWGPEGIDAIKMALNAAHSSQKSKEKSKDNTEQETEEISITMLKPPVYCLSLQTDHIDQGKQKLYDALERIQLKFREFRGSNFELISMKCYGIKDRKLDESDEEETIQ
ncbi:Alpha subunit of translation initiation factor eIF2 [Pseudoloma neurophilia]|uniref:Alpha subunit of translation initiation factor eIF2 n=1 Tax=Pseudoloma neurophilia TaxID=146866 RepID=A0A0R0M150_9MICR|nr:Alpha subunit of translation initiation factor eIF2 [Pseudoloma neurophilia]